MKLSDDDVINRVREMLSTWADEEPVSAPDLTGLDERSAVTVVELSPAKVLRQRRAAWLTVAAAALVLIGVGVVAVSSRHEAPGVVDVGPEPSSIVEIPFGKAFGVRGLAVGDDAVWVTSHFDEELYRIDPTTNQVVATFSIPSHVEGVAVVADWLWLSRYEPNEMVRVDATTGALLDRLEFDSQPGLATDGNRLWVIAERDGAGHAIEIDPDTAQELGSIPIGAAPGPSAVVGDAMWVADVAARTVSRIDIERGIVTDVIDVEGQPRALVGAAGAIWVAVDDDSVEPQGSVIRIDPTTGEVTDAVVTGRRVHAMAVDGDAIWATNFLDGTVSVIDARTASLTATSPIGNRPGGVAVGHGSIWVTPHRRNVLMRIDPTMPLEAAAAPDVTQTFDLGAGVTYIRCSGNGSPTVVLPGNKGEGAPWAVVEARLSRTTRVCAYEPVGVAEPTEAELNGPASRAADDLDATLAAIGEPGPFVIIGEWADGLDAQMFTATHRDRVVGLVLVNGMSSDYLERLRAILPREALDRMDEAVRDQPELRRLVVESSAEVAAIDGFGDLPLVVLIDASPDPVTAAASSDRAFTVAESEAIGELLDATRREQAGLSTSGRFIVAVGTVTADDIVGAAVSLLG